MPRDVGGFSSDFQVLENVSQWNLNLWSIFLEYAVDGLFGKGGGAAAAYPIEFLFYISLGRCPTLNWDIYYSFLLCCGHVL